MGYWRVPPKCQKFLHPSPQKFRQHLQKLYFFSKKNIKTADFEVWFFWWWGCARPEISVCVILGWLEEKSFLRTQSCAAPPQPSGSRFWPPRIEKYQFFRFFSENFSFSQPFCRPLGGSPIPRNFYQQQVEQNRRTCGARSKIGNIWPPKFSISKPE